MRAVQKGKIKELNKKLDQFRKMGDSNALVAQLQNEISKLNEKIAELEDDKGNLQLKMVDSTTSSKEGNLIFIQFLLLVCARLNTYLYVIYKAVQNSSQIIESDSKQIIYRFHRP